MDPDESSRKRDKNLPGLVIIRNLQYLYQVNEDILTFMDEDTFEQIEVKASFLGASRKWLIEGQDRIVGSWVMGHLFAITLPARVELAVKSVIANGTLRAVLETGAEVEAPTETSVGDILLIDTDTGRVVKRRVPSG